MTIDAVGGQETIDSQITAPDNSKYSLLAILMRPEMGSGSYCKAPTISPLTSGAIDVPPAPANALVLMLYLPVGEAGTGSPGVLLFQYPHRRR